MKQRIGDANKTIARISFKLILAVIGLVLFAAVWFYEVNFWWAVLWCIITFFFLPDENDEGYDGPEQGL